MSKRIEVYDRKNPNRLLGTIRSNCLPYPHGRAIQFAHMPRIYTSYGPNDPAFWQDTRSQTFTLELEHRVRDGWTIDICLQTNAPLSVLQEHEGWEYPSE